MMPANRSARFQLGCRPPMRHCPIKLALDTMTSAVTEPRANCIPLIAAAEAGRFSIPFVKKVASTPKPSAAAGSPNRTPISCKMLLRISGTSSSGEFCCTESWESVRISERGSAETRVVSRLPPRGISERASKPIMRAGKVNLEASWPFTAATPIVCAESRFKIFCSLIRFVSLRPRSPSINPRNLFRKSVESG